MSHGGGMKHSATPEEVREWAARPSYEELRARLKVLEEALEPFAKMAERCGRAGDRMALPFNVLVADVRRARRALDKGKSDDD